MTEFTVPEDRVVEWRRHLHAHPELSNQEVQTSAYVEQTLRDLGIETSRPTPTSVLGVIHGNAVVPDGRTPRCLALRADMDALPVQEETGLEFASQVPGVMHACGHDAHTAMLLGTAATLMGLRDQFCGTVKLLFQHAEELNPGGAKFLVEAGVMEGVDEVYGVHVMNGPAGTIDVVKGPATSSAGGFFLDVKGRGSHGSMPHQGIDPVLCAAQIVVALNHIVSREVRPGEFLVVNPGFLASGAAPNVIPDSARLGCSIRTYHPEVAEMVYRRCQEVVEGICQAYRCTFEFEWVPPYDIVVNDDSLAEVVLATAQKVTGPDGARWGEPMTGSEDFSEYLKQAPGVFVLLNAGDASDGLEFQNHHPRFTIVESAMAVGVRFETQLVLDRLGA